MARIMARSLKVDDATATYYLEEAGGERDESMLVAGRVARSSFAFGHEPGHGKRLR